MDKIADAGDVDERLTHGVSSDAVQSSTRLYQ